MGDFTGHLPHPPNTFEAPDGADRFRQTARACSDVRNLRLPGDNRRYA